MNFQNSATTLHPLAVVPSSSIWPLSVILIIWAVSIHSSVWHSAFIPLYSAILRWSRWPLTSALPPNLKPPEA